MKDIAIALNPILAHIKYLLLTALLLLIAFGIGQYVLQTLGVDTTLSANMKEGLIPFICTAAVSMFFARKLEKNRQQPQ